VADAACCAWRVMAGRSAAGVADGSGPPGPRLRILAAIAAPASETRRAAGLRMANEFREKGKFPPSNRRAALIMVERMLLAARPGPARPAIARCQGARNDQRPTAAGVHRFIFTLRRH